MHFFISSQLYTGYGPKKSWSLLSQPVLCLCIFSLLYANCVSKLQLHTLHILSEVPQSGSVLSSMHLLSFSLIAYFGMRFFIYSTHWYIIYFSEHKREMRTISCVRGLSVALTSPASSHPVADWKCLHFNIRNVFFSLHLTLCYFCTL